MEKYIITSGISMVSSIDSKGYTITNDKSQALKYDHIGDSMRACIKVNEFNGGKCYYKVCRT